MRLLDYQSAFHPVVEQAYLFHLQRRPARHHHPDRILPVRCDVDDSQLCHGGRSHFRALLYPSQHAQKAAPRAEAEDDRGRTGMAEEPAEPALPLQYAQQHIVADTDKPEQCAEGHRAAVRTAALRTLRDTAQGGEPERRDRLHQELHQPDDAAFSRQCGDKE